MSNITKEDALIKFKEFCLQEDNQSNIDNKYDQNEELDWFSLSIGFFASLGLDSEESHELARISRYKYEYWSN